MTKELKSTNAFNKRALSVTVNNGPTFSTVVRTSGGGFNKTIVRESPSKMGAFTSRIHLNRSSNEKIESGVGIVATQNNTGD